MNKRTIAASAGIAVVIAIAWWVVTRDDRARSRSVVHSAEPSDPLEVEPAPTLAASEAPTVQRVVEADASAAWVAARWGSRRGELGHERPTEGNSEGPMSFAVSAHGLYVVDQINGRLVRYDAHGKVIGSATIPETVQDVAVAKDGTTALLDRLSGKTVSLMDSSGRRVGELPLSGIGDTGTLTGVFVDGNDVYVEQDHGGLVNVGTTNGQPPSSPPTQLGGRPSKDGTLLLSASLAAPAEGKVTVNAIERARNELRFARLVQFARPASMIVLLDTDAHGTIYLGVDAGEPEAASVVCMDPGDGHVLGRVQLPVSDAPEEAFRDFAVDDDGTIVYALRTEQGVSYSTARCP
ncbi:MAG TPA: hypothetical protein VLM85_21060 [Polyangiaceae bacterium]|nr:hypothetical protein [Polyangiaceae bacterium]